MRLLETILICFAFQAFIYSGFLWFKKSGVRQANWIWAIFLFLFGLNIIYNVSFWLYPDSSIVLSLNWVYYLPFSLYGPLFYLYIKTLVSDKKPNGKEILLHCIVPILVLTNFIRYYVLSTDEKLMIDNQELDPGDYIFISGDIVFYFLIASTIAYALGSYLTNKNKYVADKEMKLWLKLVSATFGFFAISWLLYFALFKTGLIDQSQDYSITIMMGVFIGLTSYFGFYHSGVFNGKALKKIFPIIKYKKSGLSKSVLNDYKTKLLDLMESKSLYLESELKLTDLAVMMNLSRHNTSQIINECFQMSFYEFVNKYRIEEAERMLVDDKDHEMNITDIAYQVGFNNRISFYNAFKKYIGITPTEFRNQNMAS
ncbi:AraC family transcriptional regulator [Flagellimonas sp. S3867]|uniref:helix-turn-helix domain-containing protein n=1 Tax=Flagellimonas sp. S3867 TaxID=2768063 RepID=UPI001681D6C5|nr:AraC family transcriptional regulator [Flagellimonas sp. S3867]